MPLSTTSPLLLSKLNKKQYKDPSFLRLRDEVPNQTSCHADTTTPTTLQIGVVNAPFVVKSLHVGKKTKEFALRLRPLFKNDECVKTASAVMQDSLSDVIQRNYDVATMNVKRSFFYARLNRDSQLYQITNPDDMRSLRVEDLKVGDRVIVVVTFMGVAVDTASKTWSLEWIINSLMRLPPADPPIVPAADFDQVSSFNMECIPEESSTTSTNKQSLPRRISRQPSPPLSQNESEEDREASDIEEFDDEEDDEDDEDDEGDEDAENDEDDEDDEEDDEDDEWDEGTGNNNEVEDDFTTESDVEDDDRTEDDDDVIAAKNEQASDGLSFLDEQLEEGADDCEGEEGPPQNPPEDDDIFGENALFQNIICPATTTRRSKKNAPKERTRKSSSSQRELQNAYKMALRRVPVEF